MQYDINCKQYRGEIMHKNAFILLFRILFFGVITKKWEDYIFVYVNFSVDELSRVRVQHYLKISSNPFSHSVWHDTWTVNTSR